MGYGMGWRGGLYKGIWSLQGYLWACLGVFVGVILYYMGLYLYKSGESIEKWEFFVGFQLLFYVGVGGVLESLEGVEGVKGFNLWGYGCIYINFLSWKE